MGPLFQKSGLRFECEMVDTVPCLPSIKTNPPYKQRVSCCHNHSHGIHVKPLLLAKIRDWCRIMPVGSTLRNAYRARKGDRDREDAFKVPQSFTFMQRQGWFFYCWEFQTISDQLENKSKLIYAQSLGQACLAKGMGFSSRRIFHDAFEALEMQGMSLQWSSWQWVMISCASHPCWFTLIPCWNPRKDFSIVWMYAMKCWPNNWKKPVRRNSMNWLPLWKRTSPICIEGQITSGFWQILIAHGRTAAGWIS